MDGQGRYDSGPRSQEAEMDAQPMGVLVGVDGSACAQRALVWAAADAAVRGTRLTVAAVVELPRLADVPITAQLLDTAARTGRTIADKAATRARAMTPGTAVDSRVATGGAAAELLRLATAAEEVVVGSRGDGGFATLLLGSVGCQVAAHADRPVVVVRGDAAAVGGPVVVGIDGSDHSEIALEYGFGYADRHRLPLLVLRVDAPDVFMYPMVPTPYPVPQELARIRTEITLATEEVVGRWAAKYPGVRVDSAVRAGQPAEQLIEASREASLLVVGSRGHGRLSGMLLGSVSQAAVRHAHCPVAVAR
jgi:nucleotide-binding universal stress UspA family protein